MSYVRHRLVIQNANSDGVAVVEFTPVPDESGGLTAFASVSELDDALGAFVTELETNPDITVTLTRFDETGTVL